MPASQQLEAAITLMRDRAETLVQLADLVALFSTEPAIDGTLKSQHLAPNVAVLTQFATALDNLVVWDKTSIAGAIAATLTANSLKMPQLAIPLRVAVFGTPQTPGVDAMLSILGKTQTLSRLSSAISR